MARVKNQWSAADKARWLGELARAIDEAQQLVWQLAAQRGDSPRASAIYGQLEAAREEVERLQRNSDRSARLNLHPEWSELLGLAGREPGQTPAGISPPPEKG